MVVCMEKNQGKTHQSQSDFLSYQEVHEEFNLPLGTLYSLVSRQQIPHHRLGKRLVRFNRPDLLAWLAANRCGAE